MNENNLSDNLVDKPLFRHPGGRPPKYTSVDQLQPLIDQYFIDCRKNDQPITITRLAYALGFTSRQSLMEYQGKPEFADAIKRAKLRVEIAYEDRLCAGGHPGGPIFALKNFNWTDKTDLIISAQDDRITEGELVQLKAAAKLLAEQEVK